MKKQGLSDVPLFLANIFPRGCSVLNAPSTAHGARSALLRRSCDGVAAATELRRPAPSRSDATR